MSGSLATYYARLSDEAIIGEAAAYGDSFHIELAKRLADHIAAEIEAKKALDSAVARLTAILHVAAETPEDRSNG